MFGWCSQGFHADYEGEYSKPCPGKVQRFILENQKRRGQPSNRLVMLDEWHTCDCPCHGGGNVVDLTPKTKKPRGKRKK